MKRKIININQEKCTGCGLCIPNCPEGAIQILDNKARLISDLFCDGLGACLGHCPEGAIVIEEREAEPYDERKVMANIVKQGETTTKAHLHHLKDHGEMELLKQAIDYLTENNIGITIEEKGTNDMNAHTGCPGSKQMNFANAKTPETKTEDTGTRQSQLTHWPVQLHLVSPNAPQYKNADLLLSADCVAFSLGDFHKDYLKDKKLAIACPKLDDGQDTYIEKITAMIDEATVNTITVMIMQVPCCGGLLRIVQTAASKAKRKVPIKCIVVGIQGEILSEDWV